MIEDELRAIYREREPLIEPAGDRLLPSVRRRSRRHKINIATGYAAAALAVAGVLVGVTVVARSAGPPGLDATPAPTPPPGTRFESSLGAQIAVPIGWRVNDIGCLQDDQPSVNRGGGLAASCFTPMPPRKEWATIAPVRQAGDRIPKDELTAHEAPLGDVPAFRAGGQVSGGMYAGWIAVPSWNVSVTVRARSLDTVNAILDSMRLVTIDAFGCDTRTSTRAGGAPGDGFADPAPVSATVCYYGATSDGRLQVATVRYGEDARALAAALNSTPPGRAPDRPADQCLATAYPVHTNATVILRHANGRRSVIDVSWESCAGAGMSNGRTSHHVTWDLIKLIMDGTYAGYMLPPN